MENVAPYAGAWIETPKALVLKATPRSLPTRERGLKRLHYPTQRKQSRSLPTRERGLKLAWGTNDDAGGDVAPYAGAWIETSINW